MSSRTRLCSLPLFSASDRGGLAGQSLVCVPGEDAGALGGEAVGRLLGGRLPGHCGPLASSPRALLPLVGVFRAPRREGGVMASVKGNVTNTVKAAS